MRSYLEKPFIKIGLVWLKVTVLYCKKKKKKKKKERRLARWLTSVLLYTWELEIKRIKVRGQGQKKREGWRWGYL
jgi:hypothetical protein